LHAISTNAYGATRGPIPEAFAGLRNVFAPFEPCCSVQVRAAGI
jgi:hypothetical protein